MPEVYFDATTAALYDEDSADRFDPAVLGPTVDLLADLAAGGTALELAIGTGRVGLPLAARGVRVHGVDISEPMLAQLRAKPGAERITLTVGDMADLELGETFDLAYLVYNTITNLTTQEEQVACFQTAARHLRPGGRFVIETFVPILRLLPPGEIHHIFHRTCDRLDFDDYDVATQLLHSHHYWFDGDRFRVHSAPYRYVWPAELDLMARIAGLRLRERWADWSRAPFTSDSEAHVSVWDKSG